MPQHGYLWVDWDPGYGKGLRVVCRSGWHTDWIWGGGFRLGSEATADISAKLKKYTISEAQKQVIVDAVEKIEDIPNKRSNEVPIVVRNISEELNKLLSELHS